MASAELVKQDEQHFVDESEELAQLVSQQVAEILEQTEGSSTVDEEFANSWRYQVPFPGVRYYLY